MQNLWKLHQPVLFYFLFEHASRLAFSFESMPLRAHDHEQSLSTQTIHDLREESHQPRPLSWDADRGKKVRNTKRTPGRMHFTCRRTAFSCFLHECSGGLVSTACASPTVATACALKEKLDKCRGPQERPRNSTQLCCSAIACSLRLIDAAIGLLKPN